MDTEDADVSEGSQWKTIKHLLPYVWPSGRIDIKIRVVLSMAALVMAKVVTVWTPYAFKYATNSLSTADRATQIAFILPLYYILAYGLGRIMIVIFTQLRDAIFVTVAQRAVRELSLHIFCHLHALPLSFHLSRKTGGLARVISRGSLAIETIFRFSLFNTFPMIIEIAFVAVILVWSFGWMYSVVSLCMVAFYLLYTYFTTEWRINVRRAMNQADTDASTKAIDSLLNFETVKYFCNEEHEAKRFDASMAKYEKAAIKNWLSLTWLNIGQTICFTTGLILVMAMSAYAVIHEKATLGDFVLINALMIQLSMPLYLAGMTYREIKQGLIDVESMFALLLEHAAIKDSLSALPLEPGKGMIKFDRVSFSYDSDRMIIDDLSFTVQAGQTVALVGISGAGKSTISRLLYRFYEATKGKIFIDGQDIGNVTLSSLRAAIGIVPQDTVLFNDTIRYNILYGKPSASQEEIEEAAKMAQIHQFIVSLPKGYETIVGERGLKLSGGEKQRVAIARTILKDPPILVLDEATSALDSFTEKDIQEALRRVSYQRTTLVIAHRLSTVVEANEIIVLHAGRIAERGTHAALLSQNGIYKSMWERQREEVDEGTF